MDLLFAAEQYAAAQVLSLVLIDVVVWDQSSGQATAVAAAQYYANAANAAMNAAAGGGNPRMMLAPGQVVVLDMHFEILKFISSKRYDILNRL